MRFTQASYDTVSLSHILIPVSTRLQGDCKDESWLKFQLSNAEVPRNIYLTVCLILSRLVNSSFIHSAVSLYTLTQILIMPSLLDLPRELRDLIIGHVLNAPRMPPAAPSKSNRAAFIDFSHKAWLRHKGLIYHEKCGKKSILYSQVSLLLTNRQISAEIRSMINLVRSSSGVNYILDLSVLNEVELYPTWLQVPFITNRVSTLYVNVRLFRHLLSRQEDWRFTSDGGLPGLLWSFYGLLERFLQYGPTGKKRYIPSKFGPTSLSPWHYDSQDHKVTVQTLILNFESAESELPLMSGSLFRLFRDLSIKQKRNRARRRGECIPHEKNEIPHDEYTTRPELLAKSLEIEINHLLERDSLAMYGMILYERIGTIRFLIDGKLAYEYDLAEERKRLGLFSICCIKEEEEDDDDDDDDENEIICCPPEETPSTGRPPICCIDIGGVDLEEFRGYQLQWEETQSSSRGWPWTNANIRKNQQYSPSICCIIEEEEEEE